MSDKKAVGNHLKSIWYDPAGVLNLRPPDYEADALPTRHHALATPCCIGIHHHQFNISFMGNEYLRYRTVYFKWKRPCWHKIKVKKCFKERTPATHLDCPDRSRCRGSCRSNQCPHPVVESRQLFFQLVRVQVQTLMTFSEPLNSMLLLPPTCRRDCRGLGLSSLALERQYSTPNVKRWTDHHRSWEWMQLNCQFVDYRLCE